MSRFQPRGMWLEPRCKPAEPSLRPKQVVLVSRLVLIALQFGPYCKPKQVVLLESRFRLGCTEPWFGLHGTLFWAAGNKLWATGNKAWLNVITSV